jgi:hypothetical protein
VFYNTSKFLTRILSPLQNLNGFSVRNSADFADKISKLAVEPDEVMVSFDVISLYLPPFLSRKRAITSERN